MTDHALDIRGLKKAFGGVVATDNVSLQIAPNEIHAVIGPNGAGKTTLISQLFGETLPDEGAVFLQGTDITGLATHRRASLGLARSFQITSVFMGFSVIDNVSLAAQAHDGHSFQFWKSANTERSLRETAFAALEKVGLQSRAGTLASALSHGERRQLEIAMALATDPKILLLDEPMAGMGVEESSAMVELLRGLKAEKTIVLVEHDMNAVFALADRISVIVYGRVIATGNPDEIRENLDVRQAYLGEA